MKPTYEIQKKMTASDGPRWRRQSAWENWDSFTSLARARAALKRYSNEGDRAFRLIRVTRTVMR